ncbi:uncharacterized protein BXZ73DRAFT_75994 [Epithele typhae]|uniref:uncharacterized protein n=1 Tax=Epithele typhae TaxID=378194 RepID=UPI002007CFC2|nr:uncharacterized protein BXZ73DRAFT_75994 [Epithele typhae]KAH9939271.1 hypothetical protein BXZ73DRAFT_75994 [Epithele typhae]
MQLARAHLECELDGLRWTAALNAEKAAIMMKRKLHKLLRSFAHRHFWRHTWRTALCRLRSREFTSVVRPLPARPANMEGSPASGMPTASCTKGFKCASMAARSNGSSNGSLLPFQLPPVPARTRGGTPNRRTMTPTLPSNRKGLSFEFQKVVMRVRAVF